MNKLITILINIAIFSLSMLLFAQSDPKIVGYEYAFNNGQGLQYVAITPTSNFNLNTNIDVSALTQSLNILHIRFKDDSGKWSVMKSHLFMKPFTDLPVDKQIVGYEYAFNNGQGLQFVPVAPNVNFNLITNIDVSALTNTLNVLHIRFKDNTGKWSVMKSHLFMKPFADLPVDKQIVGYEYAFNNGQGLQYVAVATNANFNLITDINVSALTNTLNVLHIRFKDNTGKWSVMKSHLFMKPYADLPVDKQIVGYEYAFNNGQGLQYVPVSPSTDFNLLTDIDVSALTNTLNILHIRFKDNTGKWSVMKSHLFMKPFADLPVDKQIVGYEYAFNNGQGLQYVSVTPTTDFNLLTDIDVSALTQTLNVLHIRFKDNTGKWSVMKSHLFIKPYADLPVDKQIVGYEYAFNNGQGLQYVSVTPTTDFNLLTDIDVSALTQTLNVLHIRFKDNTGKWSVMKSHLFIKPYQGENLTANTMVGIRYWFDNAPGDMIEYDINPTQNPLIHTEVDMTEVWEGDHVLHTQYRDIYGKYSVVYSANVHKNPFPIANFTTDEMYICAGQNIELSDAGCIDYNTVLYDFGDDQSGTVLNTTHTYTNPGDYTITLTITHTESGLTDTDTKTIHVIPYPTNAVIVSENVFPVCFGTPVTITSDEIGAAYLWSNGATTRSITVTEGGNYSVEVSNAENTFCSVVSNVISVSYYPQINTNVSLQEFPLLLTAQETNANYQWLDCTNGNIPINGATQASYEPTINGDYAVQITKNGCTSTSDCVTISTVNVSDYEIKQLVKMYPNPANTFVNFSTDIAIDVSIYNTNGAIIWKGSFDKGINTFDMTNMSSGLYLTKITALEGEWKNHSTVYRLIKL